MNITAPHKTSLFALVSLIVGITLHSALPSNIIVLFLIGSLIFLACIYYFKKTLFTLATKTYVIIFLLMSTAGYCLSTYHKQAWQERIAPLQAQSFSATGYVANIAPLTARPYMAAVYIAIQEIIQQSNTQSYRGTYLVNYMPIKSAPLVGSSAVITGIKPQKPSSSDFALFLYKNSILHQLFNRTDFATSVYSEPSLADFINRPRQYLAVWRSSFYKSYMTGLSKLSSLYAGLIFFGNKTPGSDDARMRFGYWGLAHFLARSGLHIVIFVLLITLLLRMLPLHSSFKYLLMLLICLLYDALSWSSVSFLRAWLLALLVIGRHFVAHNTMYLHLLCLSAIGILACNPCYLGAVDFQLTYALTFALTLFSSLLKTKSSLARKE